MKIHLLGPCGSGTSTLGRLLAQRRGWPWFDSDDFYWQPTDPPYTRKRRPAERLALLRRSVSGLESWVLSGSMLGWGDGLRELFDLVVYLDVGPEERERRLRLRERGRFGERIGPGGDMAGIHRNLIEYSARYESGGMDIRSRLSEGEWLKGARGRVLRLEGEMSLEEELAAVSAAIAEASLPGT